MDSGQTLLDTDNLGSPGVVGRGKLGEDDDSAREPIEGG